MAIAIDCCLLYGEMDLTGAEFPAIELEEGEIVQSMNCTIGEIPIKPDIASRYKIEITKENCLKIEGKTLTEQEKNLDRNSDFISEESFNLKNQLEKHQIVSSNATKAVNSCPRTDCDFKAFAKTLLFRHIKEVHQGLRYN